MNDALRKVSPWLFAFLTWLILVWQFGYTVGIGDQLEIVPYAMYLNNPDLFPTDFYIQNIKDINPNERTVVTEMIAAFGPYMETGLLLLHILTTMFLILGMYRLARRFIQTEWMAGLVIWVSLIPFYEWTIGGNELYYNTFQASNIAKAFGIWAIVFFLDKKLPKTSLMLILSTAFHMVVGLNLFIILSVILFYKWITNKLERKDFLIFCSSYVLTAGVYMLILLMARSSGAEAISDQEYFDIIFRFRLPHHYFIETFPVKKIIFITVLSIPAIIYFLGKKSDLAPFILFSYAWLLIYVLGSSVIENVYVTTLQSFKLTIWMKYFFFIALFAIIEKILPSILKKSIPPSYPAAGLVLASLALSTVLFTQRQMLPARPYYFGEYKQNDPLISICEDLQRLTPPDASVIHPIYISSVKYFGRRSCYVEYKANVKDKACLGQWIERLQAVYGIDHHMDEKGFDVQPFANRYFFEHNKQTLVKLKADGVTHVLTKADHFMPELEVLAENHAYKIYIL